MSWNVNGLAACKRKGFLRVLANSKVDFFCCQEIKTRCPLSTPGYLQFWNPAKHPGIERFLFLSLTDVFCAWYPQADRPYIWWTMRLNKRLENRFQTRCCPLSVELHITWTFLLPITAPSPRRGDRQRFRKSCQIRSSRDVVRTGLGPDDFFLISGEYFRRDIDLSGWSPKAQTY